MAKTGTITAPAGADANLRTLGDAVPVRDTIAGAIRSALLLVVALKGVIINFAAKQGIVVPTGFSPAAIAAVGASIGTFTKDDPSKASSPWTFTPAGGLDGGISAQLSALVATRKPSLSVESLTNALEDADGDEAGAINTGLNGIIVQYDQADGIIDVHMAERADVEAFDPSASYAEDVKFVRTDEAAGGAQFGE